VLIDLAGTPGVANRLKILAKRLAPVQASFLGLPHTSSIPAMDYRLPQIGLPHPPGLDDHFNGENGCMAHMRNLAWRFEVSEASRYRRMTDRRWVRFNNVAKISPADDLGYAEIMRRVPERIWC